MIYTPDGKTVLRWDRERGVKSEPRPGEADASHITHTHISFYRDSERRPKVGLFAPFFVKPPDTSTEPKPKPPATPLELLDAMAKYAHRATWKPSDRAAFDRNETLLRGRLTAVQD